MDDNEQVDATMGEDVEDSRPRSGEFVKEARRSRSPVGTKSMGARRSPLATEPAVKASIDFSTPEPHGNRQRSHGLRVQTDTDPQDNSFDHYASELSSPKTMHRSPSRVSALRRMRSNDYHEIHDGNDRNGPSGHINHSVLRGELRRKQKEMQRLEKERRLREEEEQEAKLKRKQAEINKKRISRERKERMAYIEGLDGHPRPRRKKPHKPDPNFKPHTYASYQRNMEEKWKKELGGLGPNIYSDEHMEKKRRLQHARELARQVNAENMAMLSHSKRKPRDKVKEPTSRDRAVEYAKRVPRPGASSPGFARINDEDERLKNFISPQVQALLQKHDRARVSVEKMRAEMDL